MPNKLLRRKWTYIQDAPAYQISCDRCGGRNVTWSEFRGRVWCRDCDLDVESDGGIFSGPIPMEVAKMFGISFDRIHIKTGRILRVEVRPSGKIIWKFDRGENAKP